MGVLDVARRFSAGAIAAQLGGGVTRANVECAARLLRADNTVPFIVRYRRETTGDLEEDALLAIARALRADATLEARRQTVLRQLESVGAPASARDAAAAADDAATLEDVYLPFKPAARKSLAATARELGLGELADTVWKSAMTDAQLRASLSATNLPDAARHLGHVLSEKVCRGDPISPICRTPLFPYLTCLFLFLRFVGERHKTTPSQTPFQNPPSYTPFPPPRSHHPFLPPIRLVHPSRPCPRCRRALRRAPRCASSSPHEP